MINDKRGFVLIYGLMVGVLVFLLALAIAPALQDTTQETMNDSLLNCSTTDNVQLKTICTSIDMQNLFIAILLGVAGVIITRSI